MTDELKEYFIPEEFNYIQSTAEEEFNYIQSTAEEEFNYIQSNKLTQLN